MSSPRTLRALGIVIALIAIYLAAWQVDQVAATLTRSIGFVGVALMVAANHLKGRRQRVQREFLDDHQRKLLTRIWCVSFALLLTLGASTAREERDIQARAGERTFATSVRGGKSPLGFAAMKQTLHPSDTSDYNFTFPQLRRFQRQAFFLVCL